MTQTKQFDPVLVVTGVILSATGFLGPLVLVVLVAFTDFLLPRESQVGFLLLAVIANGIGLAGWIGAASNTWSKQS